MIRLASAQGLRRFFTFNTYVIGFVRFAARCSKTLLITIADTAIAPAANRYGEPLVSCRPQFAVTHEGMDAENNAVPTVMFDARSLSVSSSRSSLS